MKERNYIENKCNVKRKCCDVGVAIMKINISNTNGLMIAFPPKWLFVYPKEQSKAINIYIM